MRLGDNLLTSGGRLRELDHTEGSLLGPTVLLFRFTSNRCFEIVSLLMCSVKLISWSPIRFSPQ